MRVKRHSVRVKRPPEKLGDRGQRDPDAKATTILADLPASITPLTGLELIRARKKYERADFEVMCWAADVEIKSTDYLEYEDRYEVTRRLQIGHVQEADEGPMELVILASEER